MLHWSDFFFKQWNKNLNHTTVRSDMHKQELTVSIKAQKMPVIFHQKQMKPQQT